MFDLTIVTFYCSIASIQTKQTMDERKALGKGGQGKKE